MQLIKLNLLSAKQKVYSVVSAIFLKTEAGDQLVTEALDLIIAE
jgi:hypothetical protein